MSSPLTRLLAVATILFLPVLAQAVVFTNSYYTGITAGTPFVLNWSGDNTPISISLLNGDPANLQFVSSVVTSATGSSYTWTPPQVITQGVYALSVTQSGAVNYSPQFTIYSSAQRSTSQTTITFFSSTSTRIIASTTVTPTSVVSSSLIPSNTTALPSVTSMAPYPTVNQNSTYTGAIGTVASASIMSYPSATGAGNYSATGSPSFTGAAVEARADAKMAIVVILGALGSGFLMG